VRQRKNIFCHKDGKDALLRAYSTLIARAGCSTDKGGIMFIDKPETAFMAAHGCITLSGQMTIKFLTLIDENNVILGEQTLSF
jgi:hypothetical protein